MFFTYNGLNCYLCNTQRRVLRYTLTSPWSLASMSFNSSHTFSDLGDANLSNFGMVINNSGDSMFLVDAQSNSANPNYNTVRQYSLSTPHNLSTATYTGNFFRYTDANLGTSSTFRNLYINSAGNILFILYRRFVSSTQVDFVRRLSLPTSFSLSGAIDDQLSVPLLNNTFPEIETSVSSLISYSWINGDKYFRFYDVGSTVSAGISCSEIQRYVRRNFISGSSFSSYSPVDCIVTENGTFSIVLLQTSPFPDYQVGYFFETPNPGDVETMVSAYSRNLIITGVVPSYRAIHLDSTGKIAYTLRVNGSIMQITKSESPNPYNFSTGVSSYTTSLGSISIVNFTGFHVNSTGNKIFFFNVSNGRIYEYNTPSPFSITSLVTANVSFSLPMIGDTTRPPKINFSPNGLNLYISSFGSQFRGVYQYSLSSPWDISTLSSSYSKYANIYTFGNSTPSRISFSNNGKIMHCANLGLSGTVRIFSYRLDVPYDIGSLKN